MRVLVKPSDWPKAGLPISTGNRCRVTSLGPHAQLERPARKGTKPWVLVRDTEVPGPSSWKTTAKSLYRQAKARELPVQDKIVHADTVSVRRSTQASHNTSWPSGLHAKTSSYPGLHENGTIPSGTIPSANSASHVIHTDHEEIEEPLSSSCAGLRSSPIQLTERARPCRARGFSGTMMQTPEAIDNPTASCEPRELAAAKHTSIQTRRRG